MGADYSGVQTEKKYIKKILLDNSQIYLKKFQQIYVFLGRLENF